MRTYFPEFGYWPFSTIFERLGPFLSVENLAILPRFSKNFADKLICLCHIVAKMARILPFMAIFATDGKNLAIFATIWQALK